jgi:formylglycine-generating enzyme required for sulfatase activity
MKTAPLGSVLLALVTASSASAVAIDWTYVGDPGNACDTQTQRCFGAVDYSYYIGTYEVTNAQYAAFLNSVAAADPYALYNPNMSDPSGNHSGGITRSGVSGSYTYDLIAGREDLPVGWVSWYDAARFVNWMNNGQGSGDTETGAYPLLGGTPTPSNGLDVVRSSAATIALPTEDEWYKAAYYNALSQSYFDYPAASNTQIVCSAPGATPNTANCDGVDFTDVGSYTGSASPYGTFDQGGNINEWNEAVFTGISGRGVRGGGIGSHATSLAASFRSGAPAINEVPFLGFRIVMVEPIPEPGTGLLVIAGLLGLAGWRRSH